jgi:RNA polymerase sigma-70 factor, ECF subfamily
MPAQSVHSPSSEADRAWFAERVDDLLPGMYGRAIRLCRNQANAEDLVAETVARAWEALPSLDRRDAFRGWVFRILNNTFVSSCRTARSQVEHEPLDTTGDDFSLFDRLHQPILLWWGSSPETEFLNRLLRADLDRAITGLPDAFREVVVLVDIQGLGYREVGELLGVPIGTVRSRLARGRSRLQEALWEHGLEAGLTAPPVPENREARGHDGD